MSTWIHAEAEAASGATSKPVAIATRRNRALDGASNVLPGSDESKLLETRHARALRKVRPGSERMCQSDAPEPEHGNASDCDDCDIDALVSQHMQEADGLITKAEAEQRSYLGPGRQGHQTAFGQEDENERRPDQLANYEGRREAPNAPADANRRNCPQVVDACLHELRQSPSVGTPTGVRTRCRPAHGERLMGETRRSPS